MQPLLDAPPPVHPYAPGTWGPPAAESPRRRHGRWHEPWLDEADETTMTGAASRAAARRDASASSRMISPGGRLVPAGGPYLTERAWGTVREDYSADGDAWEFFPHDHARSRAYRWNEDGLAGVLRRRAAPLPRARVLERRATRS